MRHHRPPAMIGRRLPAGEIYPLRAEFSRNPARQRLWTGFLKRLGLKDVEPSFVIVTQQIAALVHTPVQAAGQNATLHRKWSPGGPWQWECFGFPLSDLLNEYVQGNPRRCYWGLGADPSVENTTGSDISSGRQPYSTP